MGTITAIITAFYSFRLISITFLTYPNAAKGDYEHTHEQPLIVVIPYVILSLLAIFFGYVAKDAFVGVGSDMLSGALFVHPSHITLVEAEFSIPLFYKLLPAVGSVLGALSALYLYQMDKGVYEAKTSSYESSSQALLEKKSEVTIQNRVYSFLNGKYYFDVIYNHYIINGALSLGLTTSKVLDRGLIEKLGPFGLTNSFSNASQSLATLDSGLVTRLALSIILGLLVLLLITFAPLLSTAYDFRIGLLLSVALLYVLH